MAFLEVVSKANAQAYVCVKPMAVLSVAFYGDSVEIGLIQRCPRFLVEREILFPAEEAAILQFKMTAPFITLLVYAPMV